MHILIVMFALAVGIATAVPPIVAVIPFSAGWIGAGCLVTGTGIAASYWSRRKYDDNSPTLQERLSWVTLAVSAWVAGYFVTGRFLSPGATPTMMNNVAMLQLTWIGIAIWLRARDHDGRDERDREIERNAYQYAYYAVLAYIGCMIEFSFSSHLWTDSTTSRDVLRYMLIGALLVGQFIESASRICLYRRKTA